MLLDMETEVTQLAGFTPREGPAHVIVLGNEKGGSGKSTTAMHLAVHLVRQGYRVGCLDLDARQGTLRRYIKNRLDYSRAHELPLASPIYAVIERVELENRSESEAREKQEEHNALVPLEGGMAILSAHLDFDLSKIPADALMSERNEPELYRMRTRFHKIDGTPMTVAETAARHGQSVSLPQFVGTPQGIADQMEAFINVAGGDGFMLTAIHSPGAIEEFVDLVVPELQKRGIYRKEYKGNTQREILNQKD